MLQILENAQLIIVFGVVKELYVMIKNAQIIQVNMIVVKFHFVNGQNISIINIYILDAFLMQIQIKIQVYDLFHSY